MQETDRMYAPETRAAGAATRRLAETGRARGPQDIA